LEPAAGSYSNEAHAVAFSRDGKHFAASFGVQGAKEGCVARVWKVPDAKEVSAPGSIAIEILGGSRYKNDGRFYLLGRKEPALNLDELHKKLGADKESKQQGPRELTLVLTEESVERSHPAVRDLLDYCERQLIPVRVEAPRGP